MVCQLLRVPVLELVFQSLCLLAIDSKLKSIYLLFLYLTILFLIVLLYDKETKDKYIGLTFEPIACNSTNLHIRALIIRKNDHVYVNCKIMFSVTITFLLHNYVVFVIHD